MRKTTLASLGLALLAGSASFAAAQAPVTAAPHGMHAGADRGNKALFHGITLTAAQKTQLKALRANHGDQHTAAERAEMDAIRTRMRTARQHNDTTAMRQARADMEARRGSMTQMREQRMAAIRQILTADQQAQFDRNVAAMQSERAARGGQGGMRGAKARAGR